jgi:hypothetical protein
MLYANRKEKTKAKKDPCTSLKKKKKKQQPSIVVFSLITLNKQHHHHLVSTRHAEYEIIHVL